MKARLKGAETGHRLLKKKADAMQLRFRSILKKIIEVKWFREIFFAIYKTQYTFGRE